MKDKALIAIVGRPNVGKSTLFNRLIRRRLAVISSIAGTTRDRIFENVELGDYQATLVDTGGLIYGKKESIEADTQSQAEIAIEEADLIYFVVDASAELLEDDFAAAKILRKSKKPVILIGNKYDAQEAYDRLLEFYKLGFGEPHPVSAVHNRGIDELRDISAEALKKLEFESGEQENKSHEEHEDVRICFVGKPNVGKSSLVNALLGEERVIVSEIPGTTRDATHTHFMHEDKKFTLIDTAGLRRRGKIEKGIEKFSSLRCFSAIEQSDVVILVMDFKETISKQDMHVMQYIMEANKGIIIVANKTDLREEEDEKKAFRDKINEKFSFLPWAPILFVSAKNKKNITKIFTFAQEIMAERQKRIPTAEFNNFIKKITLKHIPSGTKRVKPKILYVTQTGINPPEFVFFVNQASALHFSYRRYLENEIRKQYGFDGTCLNLVYRSRAENRVEKKK